MTLYAFLLMSQMSSIIQVLELGGAQRDGALLLFYFYFCAHRLIFLGRRDGIETTFKKIFLKVLIEIDVKIKIFFGLL